MAALLPKCRPVMPTRVFAPVASTSRVMLSSSAPVMASRPSVEAAEDGELADEAEDFDLSDLSAKSRLQRPTAAPRRVETKMKEGIPSVEELSRFKALFTSINKQLKNDARPAKTIDRAQINQLLSLATSRSQFQDIFETCCHLRSRALPVERFYSDDFFDRCVRYDAPRVALTALVQGQICGLVPTSMTQVWGIFERLRASLDPDNVEDCNKALRNVLAAVHKMHSFALTSADPMLLTQVLAICLRIRSEEATELFEGLQKDLEGSIRPMLFAHAYHESRSLHLREVSILLDRSLTAVREHLEQADMTTYWKEVFALIDEARKTASPPSSGPVWQRAAREPNGVARGKYGGPVRKDVPYGTPMHRVAIVNGQQVIDPHLLDTLARSAHWKHGPRAEPRV